MLSRILHARIVARVSIAQNSLFRDSSPQYPRGLRKCLYLAVFVHLMDSESLEECLIMTSPVLVTHSLLLLSTSPRILTPRALPHNDGAIHIFHVRSLVNLVH